MSGFALQRLGLATFASYHGTELGNVDDNDASLFPVAIPNPSGRPELGILHRPLFSGTPPEETACHPASREVDLDRERFLDFLVRGVGKKYSEACPYVVFAFSGSCGT